MIDLASLKKPAAGAAGAGASRPSAHEVAVTEQGLEQLVADSQRTPTLILVTSPRVAEGEQFLGSLRRAVDAQGGAVRLATVDADAQQRVAAALKVEQRSEEHTSELQSRGHLVCRLLLEKKKRSDSK